MSEELKCATCGGSGWNQAIKDQPVDITAPLPDLRGWEALKAYIRQRLLCPDCKGTGKTPHVFRV